MTGLLWSEYKNVYLKCDHKRLYENNIAGILIDLLYMPLCISSLRSVPPFFITKKNYSNQQNTTLPITEHKINDLDFINQFVR